jgi:drug/metabolite transporter (DMT)-like permease
VSDSHWKGARPGDRCDTHPAITGTLAVTWALLWASAFIATKIALRDASPPFVVGCRCLLAGVILLAITWHSCRRLTRGELARLASLGLLNNTLYLGIMAYALPNISAGMAAILSACTPLLVLCVSAATGREHLTPTRITGLVLGFGGIVLASLDRLGHAQEAAGIGLGTAAVMALAVGTLLTPRLVGTIDTYTATGWQALIGAIPLLFLAAATTSGPNITARLAITIGFLALAASVVGMTLWLTLIRRTSPGRASIAQFMPPLFSIALGAAILGEQVTAVEILAAIPVALGIALANYAPSLALSRGGATKIRPCPGRQTSSRIRGTIEHNQNKPAAHS